jgi:hypothetical protein
MIPRHYGSWVDDGHGGFYWDFRYPPPDSLSDVGNNDFYTPIAMHGDYIIAYCKKYRVTPSVSYASAWIDKWSNAPFIEPLSETSWGWVGPTQWDYGYVTTYSGGCMAKFENYTYHNAPKSEHHYYILIDIKTGKVFKEERRDTVINTYDIIGYNSGIETSVNPNHPLTYHQGYQDNYTQYSWWVGYTGAYASKKDVQLADPWVYPGGSHAPVAVNSDEKVMAIFPNYGSSNAASWHGIAVLSLDSLKTLWKKDSFMPENEWFCGGHIYGKHLIIFTNNETATSDLTGWSGYSGYNGYSGPTWATGMMGVSGVSGYSGFSGITGMSGYSGGIDPRKRISTKIYVFNVKTGELLNETKAMPTIYPITIGGDIFFNGMIVYTNSIYDPVTGKYMPIGLTMLQEEEDIKK